MTESTIIYILLLLVLATCTAVLLLMLRISQADRTGSDAQP